MEDSSDRDAFLHALNALHQGIAFFECSGRPLHANRAFEQVLESSGESFVGEINVFLRALCDLIQARDPSGTHEVDMRRVPLAGKQVWLRGTYLGMNLFGRGPSILITIEPGPPDPFSPERLRRNFDLSRQECQIARLLSDGFTNKQIARSLGLSAHTVRHYLERLFQKLEVHSRTEVVARLLRD